MSRTLATFAIAMAAVTLFLGAGCRQTPEERTAEVQNQLRQPAPPSAPTEQPNIPPEAAKVPRPY